MTVTWAGGLNTGTRSSAIANWQWDNAGCAVSYENVRRALGVPHGDQRADTAFCGLLESLLRSDIDVVITDSPKVMEHVRKITNMDIGDFNG